MRLAVLGPFLVALVACGFQAPPSTAAAPDAPPARPPGEPGAPDDAPPGVTMTAGVMITELITAECDAAFACQASYPQNSRRSFADEWGSNLAECVSTDRDVMNLGVIETAIVAGRITFDPALAASCLAAPGIPTSCATLFSDAWDWANACYDALAGHVADGDACATSWECGPSSHCGEAECVHNGN